MAIMAEDGRTPALEGGRPGSAVPRGLLRNLAIDAGLPWLAVQLMQHVWQVPTVPAFATAALFPAGSVAVNWLRRRRIDVIGLVAMATLLGGVAVALLTQDVRFAVVKGAPGFALFGVACLASLWARRPVMFLVSRQFVAGGDPAQMAAWTARLENPGFRRAMRRLTMVWGLACLSEAVLGIAAAVLLPPATALVVEPVLGVGTIAALLTWTAAFSRRRSAQAGTVSG